MSDDLPYVFDYAATAAGITTARQVILRAARRVRILAGEETMTAAELADGLQLLNDMMHGFGPRGIKYAHTTLAADDPVNVPDELIRNLVLLFAEELAVDYGKTLGELLASEVINARNEMQAAYWVQPPADTDPMLRPAPRGLDISRLT